jgi:hypothetical protein
MLFLAAPLTSLGYRLRSSEIWHTWTHTGRHIGIGPPGRLGWLLRHRRDPLWVRWSESRSGVAYAAFTVHLMGTFASAANAPSSAPPTKRGRIAGRSSCRGSAGRERHVRSASMR